MSTNGTIHTNETNGVSHSKPKYDPDFTRNVINATGPNANPRVKKVVGSLIQHLHDFARENEVTVSEWMQAVQMVNRAGQMSNDQRNEGQLMCDVIGLESLVDEITQETLVGSSYEVTKSAILGPFFRTDTPATPNDASIVKKKPDDGEVVYMHGIITDASTNAPLPGVKVDIWQCSTNGLYEQQDPEQPEWNLRGNFTTDVNGYYGLYCLRPVPYPVPDDGPAGDLLKMLDRHPFRPAHIHVIAGNASYSPLTTQIFDRRSSYLTDDSVFAVKEDLIVDFVPIEGNPKATLELTYNIGLSPVKA